MASGYSAGSAAPPPVPTSPEQEKLLQSKCFSAPGRGFKAKIDGRWKDYAVHCNDLLEEAYEAGCPSMRLNIKGQMYKFDFEKMEQKNLSTQEKTEMRAPHNVERPSKRSLLKVSNLLHPFSKGRQAFEDNFCKKRPVYIVRVPEGKAGKTIKVPHPKKLGKAMEIFIPRDAKPGQPLFLPVPRTAIADSKAKCAVGGVAAGGGAVITGVVAGEATVGAAGGAAAGAAALASSAAAPVLLGGAAVAAVGCAAAAGTHYAMKNPGRVIVIGALTIAGLAAIDHITEVGIVEAAGDAVELAGDVVEAVGDAVEAVGDAVEAVGDAAEDAMEFAGDAVDVIEDVGDHLGDVVEDVGDLAEDLAEDLLDAGDWIEDVLEDAVDIIEDLF